VPKVSAEHRQSRRRQILDGCRRAFSTYGYEGATVPHLEVATGLSRGAIFSYFPSKLDLFVALAAEDQLRVGRLWIEEGFDAVVRHVAEDPDWIGPYLDVPRMLRTDEELRERWLSFNPEVRVTLAEQFESLQAAGELRSDLTLNTLGRFLGVILDGLAVQQGSRFGIDVEGTIELVRSALAPPPRSAPRG
jgi:TetR/AcrR family transcriptional regulator, transcriptional repressor of aconitase